MYALNMYNKHTLIKQNEVNKMKHDKLDFIASVFEGETLSSFDLCTQDKGFRSLVVEHATKPLDQVVELLVDYANQNLI